MKIQEACRTPNRLNQIKNKYPYHIGIKTLNMQNKERLLRDTKEKGQVIYKGRPLYRLLSGNNESQKVKHYLDIKRPRMSAQTTYPAKLSITIDGQNKILHDRTRFKQYLATNPALYKVLEGKL